MKYILGIVAIVVIAVVGFNINGNNQTPQTSTENPNEANIETATNETAGVVEGKVTTNEAKYPPLVNYSETTLAQATKDEGRAVIMFHADWCPTCKEAVKDFRARQDQIPTDVTLLYADYDTSPLKAKYGITMQDTFVQVDAEGNEVTKWNSGGKGIETLLANLK